MELLPSLPALETLMPAGEKAVGYAPAVAVVATRAPALSPQECLIRGLRARVAFLQDALEKAESLAMSASTSATRCSSCQSTLAASGSGATGSIGCSPSGGSGDGAGMVASEAPRVAELELLLRWQMERSEKIRQALADEVNQRETLQRAFADLKARDARRESSGCVTKRSSAVRAAAHWADEDQKEHLHDASHGSPAHEHSHSSSPSKMPSSPGSPARMAAVKRRILRSDDDGTTQLVGILGHRRSRTRDEVGSSTRAETSPECAADTSPPRSATRARTTSSTRSRTSSCRAVASTSTTRVRDISTNATVESSVPREEPRHLDTWKKNRDLAVKADPEDEWPTVGAKVRHEADENQCAEKCFPVELSQAFEAKPQSEYTDQAARVVNAINDAGLAAFGTPTRSSTSLAGQAWHRSVDVSLVAELRRSGRDLSAARNAGSLQERALPSAELAPMANSVEASQKDMLQQPLHQVMDECGFRQQDDQQESGKWRGAADAWFGADDVESRSDVNVCFRKPSLSVAQATRQERHRNKCGALQKEVLEVAQKLHQLRPYTLAEDWMTTAAGWDAGLMSGLDDNSR